MDSYKCLVCGYIYRTEAGDQANGVAINTDFKDIDKDWKCPVCSHPKGVFERYDPNEDREIYII